MNDTATMYSTEKDPDIENIAANFFLEKYENSKHLDKAQHTYIDIREVSETYFYEQHSDPTGSDPVFTLTLTSSKDLDSLVNKYEAPTNWTVQSLEELEEIYEECSEKNWDGYGADKISHEAYYEATKLLNLIPTTFPMPEIAPEPDGGIGIEWYKGKGQTFIISVDGRTVIAFAGLFGENSEVYGTETFTNIIPTFIFDHLKRLFSD